MSTRVLRTAVLTRFALGSLTLLFFAHAATAASGIEAIRGKAYGLTRQHGPWMVMVASFSEPPPEQRTAGLTPAQAADELVFELRSRGMPAYTYSMESEIGRMETRDRQGEIDRRVFAARRGSVCVLAGNYASADSETAERSLKWIKSLKPKFLTGGQASDNGLVSLENGGIFRQRRRTLGQEKVELGPLNGAFLTVNPLLSPEEARTRTIDPVLLKYNSGVDNSLYANKGRYTVVVASFYGQSITQVKGTKFGGFDPNAKVSDALVNAEIDAWQLAKHLRDDRKFDAYVWHDYSKSVVTIGAFDSADDPRIAETIAKFGAKLQANPTTGQQGLVTEIITLPANPTPADPIRKRWIFDPKPEVMAVPRVQ